MVKLIGGQQQEERQCMRNYQDILSGLIRNQGNHTDCVLPPIDDALICPVSHQGFKCLNGLLILVQ